MPGQIEPITTDFWPSIAATPAKILVPTSMACQLLATKSYQNTLPLIINMLKLQQTTEHLSGFLVLGFGLGFWLSALFCMWPDSATCWPLLEVAG